MLGNICDVMLEVIASSFCLFVVVLCFFVCERRALSTL